MQLLATIRGGSWKSLTAAALSAILLIPVPALAFVFTQPNWTFVQRQVSAPAVLTTGTTDIAGGGVLQLNFGLNQPNAASTNAAAYSVIFASRNFQVTQPSETINISQGYETLLQGASLRTYTSIIATDSSGNPIQGQRAGLPSTSNRAGVKFVRIFNPSTANGITLGAGNYQINVKVEYKKNRLGVWDNTPSRPGSPHLFTFRGV